MPISRRFDHYVIPHLFKHLNGHKFLVVQMQDVSFIQNPDESPATSIHSIHPISYSLCPPDILIADHIFLIPLPALKDQRAAISRPWKSEILSIGQRHQQPEYGAIVA